jgi:hypothetical protein
VGLGIGLQTEVAQQLVLQTTRKQLRHIALFTRKLDGFGQIEGRDKKFGEVFINQLKAVIAPAKATTSAKTKKT